ncbi:MAG: GTPase Era [Lachnospiraceae bacterium]|nr:GTPase Era [Lachnospiraceae bacterium]
MTNNEHNSSTGKIQTKAGYIGIIGRPNVGKSTLMNRIIGQKIAITSSKPQTTRNIIRTVVTKDNAQLIFLDTPGIHKAQNKLGDYMVKSAKSVVNEADVVMWLVEPTDYIGAGEKAIVEILKTIRIPVILVINKVDTIRKEEILKFMDTYRKEMDFKDIIPVSALKGNNVDLLMDTLIENLPEGPFYYDPETVTEQTERTIASEIIREKALRFMRDEIPHGIAVVIDKMEFKKGLCTIEATIICEKESHKGMIIGKGGAMLKKIGTAARQDIEKMLDIRVNLKLWVKVRDNWRDDEYLLKDLGFSKTES